MKIFLVISLLLLTGWVLAKPEVLADFGGRKSEYPQMNEVKASLLGKRVPLGGAEVTSIPDQFPMRSTLTVGIVEFTPHHVHIDKPIFIVGVDDLSRQWLTKNSEYLKSIKAMGIVTNVESGERVDQLKLLAPGLSLVSVPVDEIVEAFHLSNYPVLIDREGVKQ